MNDTQTVIATPNPGPAALTGATGLSVLLGWGISLLGAKYAVPVEVLGAAVAGLTTIGTSLWHRFFGPAIPVQKPQ
jgi:hypothetical protein